MKDKINSPSLTKSDKQTIDFVPIPVQQVDSLFS